MPEKEKRPKYDPDYRDGAVRVVRETGKSMTEPRDVVGIRA
jgi:hypothetical protein